MFYSPQRRGLIMGILWFGKNIDDAADALKKAQNEAEEVSKGRREFCSPSEAQISATKKLQKAQQLHNNALKKVLKY
jgi:hypothetical protein